MAEFFAMDGYGFYIWSAYGVAALACSRSSSSRCAPQQAGAARGSAAHCSPTIAADATGGAR